MNLGLHEENVGFNTNLIFWNILLNIMAGQAFTMQLSTTEQKPPQWAVSLIRMQSNS
jgi:hypothetical protein